MDSQHSKTPRLRQRVKRFQASRFPHPTRFPFGRPSFAILIFTSLCLSLSPPATALADAPLADAVERQDRPSIERLLNDTGNVNARQPDGMTALHWSIYHDDKALTEKLLKLGADATAANRYDVRPLSLACRNGNAQIVQSLLEAGADPNTTLPGGETALMTASRTGKLAPVQQLLRAGADIHARERKKQTALMWAAAEGHVEVVDALLQAGAEADAKLDSGFSALFFAVREGKTAVVRRLLDAGLDVNQSSQFRKRNRFIRSELKFTPLLMAVENGHFELAHQLLRWGADPNAKPSGYTALHAITWVRKPIRGDGDPSPQGSGNYSSLDMVRILVDAGADIDIRLANGKSGLGRFNYTGSTPFLLAAQAADLSLMELLFELGADPRIPNVDETTPLLAASGVGALGDGDEAAGTEDETLAAAEFLIQHGANLNAVDNHGETFMHGAAYQSLPRLVAWASERGADVDVWHRENRAGWTPHRIALGYRPGNFRPDPATIEALESAIVAAGRIPPDHTAESHRRSWSGSSNGKSRWIIRDIEYARVDDISLQLDLHFPQKVTNSKLVVWVHGGAWRRGSKSSMPLEELVKAGYTVASVDYRLSPVAKFPAQVHDIKAAIRFLRAHAKHYRYATEHIAIAGASAGGHLAGLVGVTNGHAELEGNLGQHSDQSSDVQAIIDYYGPTNFLTILPQSTPHGLSVRVPALELLLGGQPEEKRTVAELGSPVLHVDKNDPPLLLIHGDQDPQVPINQSHELHARYKAIGLPVQFEVVHGGAHGGPEFHDEARVKIVKNFLETHLRDDE